MENFGRSLEMIQCPEHKSFAGIVGMFSEGRTLVEDER
jgi:hypothetical protein